VLVEQLHQPSARGSEGIQARGVERRLDAVELRQPLRQPLEQGGTIGEVAIHRALRHAGCAGDVAGGHLVGAPIAEQGGDGIEDELPGLGDLTFAQRRRVGPALGSFRCLAHRSSTTVPSANAVMTISPRPPRRPSHDHLATHHC
jgi:hypothetical protein